jgi:hypothetical protein
MMDSVEDILGKLRGILGEAYASGGSPRVWPEDVKIMQRFFAERLGKDLANAAVDLAAQADWMDSASGEAFKKAMSAQSPVWGEFSRWFFEVFMPIVEQNYNELKREQQK